uniref:Caffeoyl-CoA O-methyltransferase At1g67980 family n=1 Tax=Cajanus cajan TaxID=3821 RepID=A0A151SDS6_CAJCA|nr:Putative caffeoyl-CoA O-methyltransferase At1g67980 family [Cajanus cajan]
MENLSVQKNILKTPALLKYIFETSGYPKEHEQLKQLRETTVQKYGNKSLMNVPVDEAQFMSILLKVMNAKKTLEIGVFTGYSLLSTTALALPSDGKIIGIDVDREAYETGLPFMQKAGVEHKIDFIQADALSALHDLIDVIVLDFHDNSVLEKVTGVFYSILFLNAKLVKNGGIIALWNGTVAMSEEEKFEGILWENRKPTMEFNSYIANDKRIESSILVFNLFKGDEHNNNNNKGTIIIFISINFKSV